jgi:MoxR-like ATPase
MNNVVRQPCEELYSDELAALAANDKLGKPVGWRLSPRAVRRFILGSGAERLEYMQGKESQSIAISQKFYGADALVDRCIVTLMSNRGLMLVGEPGTAKSMLSELLSAAISGDSGNTIQGTAGTTEDQIHYSWNYALLLAEGPSVRSLVPSPVYTGMKHGRLVRFEEITRCAPEIQDALINVLSESALHIPELQQDSVLHAKQGFNIIATANIRDRGVNEMSSALKRRFNFETVPPINDKALELRLVQEQARRLLSHTRTEVKLEENVLELLVTTFHDLRQGKTEDGHIVDKPTTVMSTAEAVSVAYSAALDAAYFGNGVIEPIHLVKQLIGTAIKDNTDDIAKIQQYFDSIVKLRARKNKQWQGYYDARKQLTL